MLRRMAARVFCLRGALIALVMDFRSNKVLRKPDQILWLSGDLSAAEAQHLVAIHRSTGMTSSCLV